MFNTQFTGVTARLSRFLPLAALALLASCSGGTNLDLQSQRPEIELRVAGSSGLAARDLRLELWQEGEQWSLSLTNPQCLDGESLLVELHFDPAWQVGKASQLADSGFINLLVGDKPGVLALGMIMPEGDSVPQGELLSATLVPSGLEARSASAVPKGDSGLVADLVSDESGVDSLKLNWSYANRADYDQNSEANIADLTPLALRLGQSTTDGEMDEFDSVLDGDGNTEVNLADITPLGINFLNTVSGYRVYMADGPDPQTASSELLQEVQFAESTMEPNTRRVFSMDIALAALVPGRFLYVRPFDSASGEEGNPSNAVEYAALTLVKYRVPPSGEQVISTDLVAAPALVALPAVPALSQSGAPVVVYTTLGGAGSPLLMSYFGEAGWTTQDIGDGGNYANPHLLLLPAEGGNPPEMLVIAYSIEGLKVVERRYALADWSLLGSQDVGTGNGAPTMVSVDMDSSGNLGVAHAYAGAGASVQYSSRDAEGSWNTIPVYGGSDTVGGLSFRFDPGGADPWLIFTHGTIDTSSTLLLDFVMEQGRLSSGSWNVSELPDPDNPLVVDLGFRADNTPQLAITSARDYTISIPTLDPVTLSLLVDVDSLEYNGTSWVSQRAYESTFGVSLGGGFPPSKLVLTLNLASEVMWAKPDELLYNQVGGSVDVNISTQQPEDGSLDTDSQYMKRGATNFYTNSGYYSGSSGRGHSWSSAGGGNPSCAFLRTSSISVSDLLSGEFNAAGELAYWRP
ncbi:hypothetical protein KDL29_13055 [bacterium]|nr:hypothetical protein [bacterium]